MHRRSIRRVIAKLRVNQSILFVQTVSFVFLVGGWLKNRLDFNGLRGLPFVNLATLDSERWRSPTGRAMLYRVLISLSIQIDLRQVIVDLTLNAGRNALRPRPLNILVDPFFVETLSLRLDFIHYISSFLVTYYMTVTQLIQLVLHGYDPFHFLGLNFDILSPIHVLTVREKCLSSFVQV